MHPQLTNLRKLYKAVQQSPIEDSQYIRQKIIKKLTRFEPQTYLEQHRKEQLLNKLTKQTGRG